MFQYSTPGATSPGTHWVGGWESPRAGLDIVAKRKNPLLTLPGIEHQSFML